MADECDFCRIASGALSARIVHASDSVLAFFPLESAVVGHTLVVPRAHVKDFFDLSGPLAGELSWWRWRERWRRRVSGEGGSRRR